MRKITSLTLIIAGIFELITSVVLYIIPSGRVAYWADYHLFGLGKKQWGDIHITVGTLLLLSVLIHIYYNWRSLLAYIKNKTKQLTIFTKSFNIALLVSLYVAIGTLYNLPPMNYVLQLGTYFTEAGNEKYGEPPYGHAELSSLKMFCNKMNIDLRKAVELLKRADMKMKGVDEPLVEMAKNNSLTPQQLYDIFKPATITQEDGGEKFPDMPSPSFGKKTIKNICQIYKLPMDDVLSKIRKAGFSAHSDDTVKEIGANNNTHPMRIFEILKEVADGES